MKKYQVHIDLPIEGDWDNIEVETIVIEAFNCDDAKERAVRYADSNYDDSYVWEITEDDIID